MSKKTTTGIPLIKGVLLLIAATGLLFCMMGCTASSSGATEDQIRNDVIDYYSAEAVQDYHQGLSSALTEASGALSSGDEKALKSSLKDLDALCDSFIEAGDVPKSLEPYHEKMVEAAQAIRSYSDAVRDEDTSDAPKYLLDAQDLMNEAYELLPVTVAESDK